MDFDDREFEPIEHHDEEEPEVIWHYEKPPELHQILPYSYPVEHHVEEPEVIRHFEKKPELHHILPPYSHRHEEWLHEDPKHHVERFEEAD